MNTNTLRKVWYIQPGYENPTEVEINIDHNNLSRLCHARPVSCVMFNNKDRSETYTLWFDDFGMSNETDENINMCAVRIFSRIHTVSFGTFHGYFVVTKSINNLDDDSIEPEYVDMDIIDENEFIEFCNRQYIDASDSE